MKFKPTRKEFTLEDGSGYSFHVVLTFDDEYGWNAAASFASHGYKNEHGALSSLRTSIERFLTMLKDVEP